jgi:putative sigma-54 modulation protein
MKVKITGKNITLTDALKNTIEKKIGKLDKYLNSSLEAHVTLSVQKSRQIIEVTIPFNGVILRGEEASENMYVSIDNVVDKLEKQIIRYKTKLERRIHGDSVRFSAIPQDEDFEDGKLVRVKKFAVKPMDTEEAVLQMDLLGHNFYVFRNADTNEVNVVYKRKDGNYGLIEPEF